MSDTDDLLRELVAESRVQTTHLKDMKTSLSQVATKENVDHASELGSQEHQQILAKAGNGNKDKLLLLMTIALIVLAGATSAVTLWMKANGG